LSTEFYLSLAFCTADFDAYVAMKYFDRFVLICLCGKDLYFRWHIDGHSFSLGAARPTPGVKSMSTSGNIA
jgi:hypothetical protein